MTAIISFLSNAKKLSNNWTLQKQKIVIDLKKNASEVKLVYFNRKQVERVQKYKYLGTIFDTTLKFQQISEAVFKKVHQKNVYS